MTRDDIQALLVRRETALRGRNAAAMAALHDINGVVASPTGGVLEGRADIERVYALWFSAFPDFAIRADTPLIDGDRAVQILRMSGTHAGEFFGLAATNRHVDVTMACVMTLADNQIIDEQRIYDFTGLLVQVGVLKAKPQG